MGRVVGPAGHAEVDLRHGPVAVAAQEARQPGLHDGGKLALPGNAGPAPAARRRRCARTPRPTPASARMAAASCQRARSISVVTLLGSPRRTACSAPVPAPVPSSFPAAASRANPRAGSGRMAGTTGKSSWPRMRSTWSSRCAGGGPGRHHEGGPEPFAEPVGPAQRRLGPEQGAEQGLRDSGPRRHRDDVPQEPPRRPDGDGEPGIGEQPAQHGGGAGLHDVEHPRDDRPSRSLLRTTGVRSKKMRWPACDVRRGPVARLRARGNAPPAPRRTQSAGCRPGPSGSGGGSAPGPG